MICLPGKCIKCDCRTIIGSSGVTPHTNEVWIEMELPDKRKHYLLVGVCQNCYIQNSELREVVDAIDEYNAPYFKIQGKPKRIVKRLSANELRLEQQGGRCLSCLKKIKLKKEGGMPSDVGNEADRYIVTNGMIICERCQVPRPRHKHDDLRAMGKYSVQEIEKIAKRSGVSSRKN